MALEPHPLAAQIQRRHWPHWNCFPSRDNQQFLCEARFNFMFIQALAKGPAGQKWHVFSVLHAAASSGEGTKEERLSTNLSLKRKIAVAPALITTGASVDVIVPPSWFEETSRTNSCFKAPMQSGIDPVSCSESRSRSLEP
jgi:hypothetical protein